MKSKQIYEHIRAGTYSKYLVYPPSSASDVVGFEDALKEIIPQKLQILLERAEELREERDRKLEVISKNNKKDTFYEYFNVSIVMFEFSEYYMLQRWVKYWLNLWYKITPQSLPRKLNNGLDSFDAQAIEHAKESLIQDHYEGRLRRVGSRFVGLCCFHKEKTPSFYIFPDNHWHCFGACSEGGDVISFIMKLKNLTFPETVRYLL